MTFPEPGLIQTRAIAFFRLPVAYDRPSSSFLGSGSAAGSAAIAAAGDAGSAEVGAGAADSAAAAAADALDKLS